MKNKNSITVNDLRSLIRECIEELKESDGERDLDVLLALNDKLSKLKAFAGQGWRLKASKIKDELQGFAESMLKDREVEADGVPSGKVIGIVTRVDVELGPKGDIILNLSVLPSGERSSVRVNKVKSLMAGTTWSV